MPWEDSQKNSKLFTPEGTILIFTVLFCALLLTCLENSGKLTFHWMEIDSPIIEIKPLVFPKKYIIGFTTDAHAKANKKNILNTRSEEPMKEFVSRMNIAPKPDFVVDGGDFIDGTRRFGAKSDNDFLLFDKIFQRIESTKYRVLGNHELRGFTREDWSKKTRNTNSYYFFDYDEKLRVIIFDSTLITATLDEKNPKKIAYEKELVWLKETLAASQDKKIIIFSHHPPIPILGKGTPPELITRLNDIFSHYHVRAVFSGHVEILYYEKIGGVDYFVAPGFYRSEATGYPWIGSFAQISIGYKNHLRLYYKKDRSEVTYQDILVPSPQYYAIEKEEKEKVHFLAPGKEYLENETGINEFEIFTENDATEKKNSPE